MDDFTDPWNYPLFHMSVEEQLEMERANEEQRRREEEGSEEESEE